MTKFYYGGRVHAWREYTDYEIKTESSKEYWRLSHDSDGNYWYAMQLISENEHAPFEDGRMADDWEVSEMLATVPVEKLPASAFYNSKI